MSVKGLLVASGLLVLAAAACGLAVNEFVAKKPVTTSAIGAGESYDEYETSYDVRTYESNTPGRDFDRGISPLSMSLSRVMYPSDEDSFSSTIDDLTDQDQPSLSTLMQPYPYQISFRGRDLTSAPANSDGPPEEADYEK